LRATVNGYTSVRLTGMSMRTYAERVRYALMPVWLLSTSWNGGRYTFAMNGQTGKFVGDLPLDKGAFCRWLFGLFGGLAAIGCVIAYFVAIAG